MSREATVRVSLQVRLVDSTTGLTVQDYQSRPTAFLADVANPTYGPKPGNISVSLSGTDIDLSGFTRPALYCFKNKDTTNRVEYGIYEPTSGTFYPLGELLAGEVAIGRLSRNIQEQFDGTVTGTGTFAVNNTLRFKAYGAAVNVQVDIFDA